MRDERTVGTIIIIAMIIIITYFIVDYTCGWSETTIKVRDKTWDRSYHSSTDSNGHVSTSTTIHYYLICELGKMETSESNYNRTIIGHEYLVLVKDVRIKKIIKEINIKGER